MGHVVKRRTAAGTVRWQARVSTPAGRKVATFARKRDAEEWVEGTERAVRLGEWIDPAAGRVTVAEWAQRWQASRVGLRPATIAQQDSCLRTHVLPTFGSLALSAVEHHAVREWVAGMDRRLAAETTRKAYRVLHQLMASAVAARLIRVNPAEGVPLPAIVRELMRFLTPAEIARLAEAIDERYAALVWVGAYGGLRIGELAGLRRGRVRPPRVQVVEQAVEVAGRVTVGPPKTAASRRSVSLPAFVVRRLVAHLDERVAPGPDALVFPSPLGGLLSRTRFRQRAWLPAVEQAGLEGLRVHDLRHTAVSLWIAEGATAKQVAARAGHTSVSVVLDRYGHLYDEADDDLAARLDGHDPDRMGHLRVLGSTPEARAASDVVEEPEAPGGTGG